MWGHNVPKQHYLPGNWELRTVTKTKTHVIGEDMSTFQKHFGVLAAQVLARQHHERASYGATGDPGQPMAESNAGAMGVIDDGQAKSWDEPSAMGAHQDIAKHKGGDFKMGFQAPATACAEGDFVATGQRAVGKDELDAMATAMGSYEYGPRVAQACKDDGRVAEAGALKSGVTYSERRETGVAHAQTRTVEPAAVINAVAATQQGMGSASSNVQVDPDAPTESLYDGDGDFGFRPHG